MDKVLRKCPDCGQLQQVGKKAKKAPCDECGTDVITGKRVRIKT